MADPLSAQHLVVEDALHSRGLLDDETLADEQRQLEEVVRQSIDRKGKGKQRMSSTADDMHEYRNGGFRPAGSSTPDANASGYRDARMNGSAGYGRANDEHDEDAFHEDIPLHSASSPRARGHRRSESILGGLLEKAPPAQGMSKEQLRSVYIRRILVNCLFIAAWYTCSTLISLYNKWMFSPEHYNFGFPLFVTSCHMLVQFTLCSLVLTAFPSLRPKVRPSPRDYGTKAVPCGLATGMDIGLSNLSLKTITLTFYTMCKSSVLGFVLLFAFLFKLEKPTLPLISVIAVITAGVIMMVSAETQFQLVGMLQVLTASALSGLRWSLTQILLDKESMGMNNPFATLFWLAPIMGISLAVCSIFIEGWWTILTSGFFDGIDNILKTVLFIALPGFIAFSMNVAEFALIQRTSVVTLSVAGIFKEVATIFLSTTIFHDQLTPINISGLCVALLGIAGYNYLKYRAYRQKERDMLEGNLTDGAVNGDAYPPRLGDTENQFELVGEHDLDSDEDEGDHLEGERYDSDARSLDTIKHLPPYAATHPDEVHAETQALESKIHDDPVLLDLESEEHSLQQQMRDARAKRD